MRTFPINSKKKTRDSDLILYNEICIQNSIHENKLNFSANLNEN